MVCTSNAHGLKRNDDNGHSCIDITVVCTSNAYDSKRNKRNKSRSTTCLNQNVSLNHPIYLNEAPSQRKKHTRSVTSLAANSYFLILLRCVIVQKQAVEVAQRLFMILGLFKAHNCWKTVILLHLHLFKKQNIENRRKKH